MLYTILRSWLLLIARLFFHLRVEGVEHIPASGGVIFAVNHVSYVDPLVIGVAVGRRLHFMAKAELFQNRAFAWFLRRLNAFPVSRNRMEPSTLKRSLALLKAGEALVVFPEGTRGDGLTLGKAKPGIRLLAKKSRAVVVPVYHRGAERILPKGAFLPRLHPVIVWFGKPFRFPADAGSWGKGFVEFEKEVMEEIAALRLALETEERIGKGLEKIHKNRRYCRR